MVAIGMLLTLVMAPATADLTVRCDAPGFRSSPMLWGLFFEEINHAGDGGLYAELVRNRSFDGPRPFEGWRLITEGDGAGEMAIDDSRPFSQVSPRSLRLRVDRCRDGRVAVANEGYFGIGVREGGKYELSFRARRSTDLRGTVRVSLEHASGRVLAQAELGGLSTEWRRHSCVLHASADCPDARLVIAASDRGTLWLDHVSLFPQDTWKRRPNGLRPDLATMLADINPAFVRFPGGCFVEGPDLENAWRWKTTIGDPFKRPGHWNLWDYWSTDGLGFHEYLQLCEDLGAEPLFVINCGMACQARNGPAVPMDDLGPWVQDALDAIEYANGPVDSTWGRVRARNGHAEPFGLRYIEIGNENWGPGYEERYARFYRAIKERYPEMTLIADARVSSAPVEIVDEHYYSTPEWFAANADRYDSYDRSGPRVYVGEYAVTQGCGQGNLRAAVAEAAFMMGMERNSDIVVMASYAPLFVHVNKRTWNPDAIVFDSLSCYGTPSYHVQRLFGQNAVDVVLPTELACGEVPVVAPGRIGVATWDTQAEFKDIRVMHGGQTLLAVDFARGSGGFVPKAGEWSVGDGAYRQTGTVQLAAASAGDTSWVDYTYMLKARKLSGAEGFLIRFRERDDANWYWWNIGGWGNQRHAIERSVNGSKAILGDPVDGRVETGRWYDIRVELAGPRIRCYLDGKLIHDVVDRGPKTMAASAGWDQANGELVLKVVNLSDDPQATRVRLSGVRGLNRSGRALVLTSSSPDDENSLARSNRVAPVELDLAVPGPEFTRTFPPHSLTVLRMGANH